MAERRMFSRTIVDSGRFLRMSVNARLLYFDLGMDADDEGFVEALGTLRRSGCKEKYLKELEEQGFVTRINADPVIKILDWTTNNRIRKDRLTPSRYTQMTTNRQPNGNQMTAQYSIV